MKTRVIGVVLFVLVLGAAGLMMSGHSLPLFAKSSASASAAPAAPAGELVVRVRKATKKPLSMKVPTNGTLRSNESVTITAEVSRRLVKVHAKDGERVKKGQLLFELDATDLSARAAEASVKQRSFAIVEERQRKLLGEGLSSKNDYDKAKADLDLAVAQLSVVSADLVRTRIVAPFDGKLGLRQVSEGAMVGPTTPLITLEDDSRVKIDFTVPERFSPHVVVGAKFTFEVEGGKPLAGEVIAIEPKLDERTRSVKLRGLSEALDASRPTVFAGQYVSVELAVESKAEVMLLPAEVVVPSLGGHSVFVVEEGAVKPRSVELGIRTDTEVGISKGLEPGELVAISNLLKLRPGAKVKPVEEAP